MNFEAKAEPRAANVEQHVPPAPAIGDSEMPDASPPMPSRMSFLRKSVRAVLRPVPLMVTAWLMVLGTFAFWPPDEEPSPALVVPWYLSPPLADKLLDLVDDACEKGLTARETITFVMPDGKRLESETQTKFSLSPEGCRCDVYASDQLQESQWFVPTEDELTQTTVRLQSKTYEINESPKPLEEVNRLTRLRSIIDEIDQAGGSPDVVEINGRTAACFSIPISQSDDSREQVNSRLWLDIKTKLPLRLDIDMHQAGDAESGTEEFSMVIALDHFAWGPPFEDDTFIPLIPKDFTPAPKK